MPYDLFNDITGGEAAKVQYLLNLFNQRRAQRTNYDAQCEEIAALCWPEYMNTIGFGNRTETGTKKTQFQVDSTGSIYSHRFMAIANAIVTPFSRVWSMVKASNPELMKDRSAKTYFSDVTKALWTHRYRPEANFAKQQMQNWQTLGVFGNQGMLIDALDPAPGRFAPGLRYMSMGPGELYVLENHQGRVDGFIRYFRWTARQAAQRWGMERMPPVLLQALQQNSQLLYDFLQFVMPRTDYDPNKTFTPQGKPWLSCYLSVTGQCIMEEGGYTSFPLAYGRYQQVIGEVEGRGPGHIALPSLKTLNAEKADFLKQGHQVGDPSYLIGDDGLLDFKTHPGAFNYGGFTEKGKMLVAALPAGNIQTTLEMMQEEQKVCSAAFLNDLFPALFDDKGGQRNARAMIEAASDKGIFLGPLAGQYGEYIGPMIERELDLLSYLGLLPEMPPAVKEAEGEYETEYTSLLTEMMDGDEVVGFMRTAEMIGSLIQVGGDPAMIDYLEMEEAVPGIAEKQRVNPRWIASPQKVAAKAKQRAQAAERDRQVKELPGKAAIMKAQAISDKAATGGNTGGALTGQPEGAMPMMPGQTAPGGRAFSQPG